MLCKHFQLTLFIKCYFQFEEIKREVSDEALLDEHILDPVVDELVAEVAVEVIQQQNSKLKDEEYKEV